MTYRARVDKDVCISSGKCVADAPAAFDFDDDEIAEAIEGHPGLSDQGLVDLARTCPSGAIHVYAADGSEVEVS